MISLLKEPSDADLDRLAELHTESLPDSLVSKLGRSYARSFYRYVVNSSDEFVLVGRDEQGRIFCGCVMSLAPGTLSKRLLWKTPVLFHGLLRVFKILSWKEQKQAPPETTQMLDSVPKEPEFILMFTSAELRGGGWGKKMVEALEQHLIETGVTSYFLKTIDSPDNRAIALYERLGYQPLGSIRKEGRQFRVFRKTLLGG